ncbi:MAG: hypothetical protein ACM3VX_00320, partial [Bacteroidota bacterium]
MALSRSEPQECSRLATLTAAALKLGWPVGRVRYYEARYREELGCLRLPDGDPLFTDRQLQVLKNLDGWLRADGTPDRLVRERLVALGRWLREDIPLAPAPTEVASCEQQATTTSSPETGAPPLVVDETEQGISVQQNAGDAARQTDLAKRDELSLLGQQLQDLTERIRGMEETLSALLTYLQELRAPEPSEPPEPPSTATPTPGEIPAEQLRAGPVIKHTSAKAGLKAGLISRWEAPELDPVTLPVAAPQPLASQAAEAEYPASELQESKAETISEP